MDRSTGSSVGHYQRCRCGVAAVIRTSDSVANPGKRYFKCATKRCGYFNWLDKPPVEDFDSVKFDLDMVFNENDFLKKELAESKGISSGVEGRLAKLEETVFRQWIFIVLLADCFIGSFVAMMTK